MRRESKNPVTGKSSFRWAFWLLTPLIWTAPVLLGLWSYYSMTLQIRLPATAQERLALWVSRIFSTPLCPLGRDVFVFFRQNLPLILVWALVGVALTVRLSVSNYRQIEHGSAHWGA